MESKFLMIGNFGELKIKEIQNFRIIKTFEGSKLSNNRKSREYRRIRILDDLEFWRFENFGLSKFSGN